MTAALDPAHVVAGVTMIWASGAVIGWTARSIADDRIHERRAIKQRAAIARRYARIAPLDAGPFPSRLDAGPFPSRLDAGTLDPRIADLYRERDENAVDEEGRLRAAGLIPDDVPTTRPRSIRARRPDPGEIPSTRPSPPVTRIPDPPPRPRSYLWAMGRGCGRYLGDPGRFCIRSEGHSGRCSDRDPTDDDAA